MIAHTRHTAAASGYRARVGWPVQVVARTGSTNADVAERARAGETGPLFLAARAQSAGRGRLAREWRSPPGDSLSLSLLWSPTVPQARWTWLPMVVGLGVLDGCAALGATGARLKWPNDVVLPTGDDAVDDAAVPDDAATVGAFTGLAKLAGILVEGVVGPGDPVVVAGVGLNLRAPGGDLARTATSLAQACGSPVDFDAALTAVAAGMQRRLEGWERAGGDPEVSGVRRDYLAVCSTLGRDVRVVTPRETHEGHAVDIDADGALVVALGRGQVRVSAGDVTHVR